MKRKKGIYFLISIGLIILIVLLLHNFEGKACAKYNGRDIIRMPCYSYEFRVRGKKYVGCIFEVDTKMTEDELKKIECIKIE